MRDLLLVAAGGAGGSVLRWWLSGLAQHLTPRSPFPWGTLAINVAGSFAIGVVLTLALELADLTPEMRLLLATGVLGGFTTFSAYSYETLTLLRTGHGVAAFVYAAGSVLLGLGAAALARAMTLALARAA